MTYADVVREAAEHVDGTTVDFTTSAHLRALAELLEQIGGTINPGELLVRPDVVKQLTAPLSDPS